MAGALDDLAVVALGSSLPGPYPSSEALLEAALAALEASGVEVQARSSWWRSQAWPDASRPAFLNGVALARWTGSPETFLALLKATERAFGRAPDAARNAPRTLDLDLIAFGRLQSRTDDLTLPHPRAAERRFVMGPLAEIAPDWRHPISGRTAAELADQASVGRDAAPIGQGHAALHNGPPNAI